MLFISPVIPFAGGNGLAMRAWHNLNYFARNHNIILVIMPWKKQNTEGMDHLNKVAIKTICLHLSLWDRIKTIVRALCSKAVKHTTPFALQILKTSQTRKLRKLLRTEKVDIIHIFRLYTAAKVFQSIDFSKYDVQTDLDNLDADHFFNLGIHYWKQKSHRNANTAFGTSEKCLQQELQILPQCKRIFTSTNADKIALQKRISLPIAVLPNTVDDPKKNQNSPKTPIITAKFRMLFSGSLNYPPNRDAIDFFCSEIYPLIKKQIPNAELVIYDPEAKEQKTTHTADLPIKFINGEKDVNFAFEHADLMIVPLRFGVRSREKIIEAFSRNCPVVSTSIGAQGIEAVNKYHLLIANNSYNFAIACIELYKNKNLSAKLSYNAHLLVNNQYCDFISQEHD